MSDAPHPICSWAELPAITDGEYLGDGAVPHEPSAAGLLGVVTDSRHPIPAGRLFLALRGERFDGHDFLAAAVEQGAAALCVESIPPDLAKSVAARGVRVLRVADTLAAYQAIARHHRLQLAPSLVAITGSSGKTSTKTIVAALLAAHWPDAVLSTVANTNNQVGVPQNLLRLEPHHRAAVIEMGTSGPGEIRPLSLCGRPDIAVLTNVGPVHLERLGSVDGVAAEKATIFEGLDPARGWAILPASLATHPAIQPLLPPGRTLTFGPETAADFRVEWLGGDLESGRFRIHRPSGPALELSLPVPGAHQAGNAAIAVAVAQVLQLPDAVIQPGLAAVVLPGMRMCRSEFGGVHWINDAYNANPDSVAALVRLLADIQFPDGPLHLVLGDMLELGPDEARIHAETLAAAREALPDAVLHTVGPRLLRAAAALHSVDAHADTDGLRPLLLRLAPGATVVLKASRGLRLERLLPAPPELGSH